MALYFKSQQKYLISQNIFEFKLDIFFILSLQAFVSKKMMENRAVRK